MLMSDLKMVFEDLIEEHGDLDVTIKVDGKHEEFQCANVTFPEQDKPKVSVRPGGGIPEEEAK